MHTTLSSVRASVRSNPLIAILTCLLIAQVAMGDMPNDRDERIATLQTWFHVNGPDGPIDEEGIQEFLDELKEVHFMDAVAADGRAAAIISSGYTSKHGVAGLTAAELVDLGFLRGNAKQMAMYLGSKPRDPSPAILLSLRWRLRHVLLECVVRGNDLVPNKEIVLLECEVRGNNPEFRV